LRKDLNVTGQEQFEVIAKFADGERVDTQALRAALADEAGRDYLIDLVAMREIVAQTQGQEARVHDAGGVSSVADDRVSWMSARTRAVGRRGRAMTMAATLAMAVGLAGYAIGQQRSQIVSVAVLPPLAADVIVAEEAPPAPTQVIRLGSGEPGKGGR
jgi:hypothetical protein